MWLVHIAHRDRLIVRQFQREPQIARPHRANADVAGCDAVVSAFHASGEQGGGQRRGSAFEYVSSLDHWFCPRKMVLIVKGKIAPLAITLLLPEVVKHFQALPEYSSHLASLRHGLPYRSRQIGAELKAVFGGRLSPEFRMSGNPLFDQ